MLTLPTVLKNLVLDQSLISRDTQVFIVAWNFLDDDEFKPLKLRTISQLLGMTPSPVHASMRRLTEQGYIERGPRKKGGPVTFRIPPHLTLMDAPKARGLLPRGTSREAQTLADGDRRP